MKRALFALICLMAAWSACAQKASELVYTDARQLMIINKAFDNAGHDYARLPVDMKDETRKAVWDLGLNSAGIAVRFSSDSKCIGARWTLLNNFNMNHMPGTGIRGIDLYALIDGKWLHVGTCQPNGKESQNVFVRNMDGQMREYLAYMPLYDGAVKVEFGIDSTATIGMPRDKKLTKGHNGKPIVFYGTSITQGGCASRPGMVYTSIIGRWADRETINLGFSGNARMDQSMEKIISRIDAYQYVIDCLPNCTEKILRDSAYTFMSRLASEHPDTPIYMVENLNFPSHVVDVKSAKDNEGKNGYWKELYKQLRKEGHKNLRYIKADGLIGDDNESTVDTAHQTDLGFLRMATNFYKKGIGK